MNIETQDRLKKIENTIAYNRKLIKDLHLQVVLMRKEIDDITHYCSLLAAEIKKHIV